MGRHPYQPTPEDKARVKRLASFKLPHTEIAKLVINRQTGGPIAVDILREYFPEELGIGALELFATVADRYAMRLTGAKAEFDKDGNMVRGEILPSEQAQAAFLKTFGAAYGWAGPTDDPFAGLDLTKLTDVELATLKAIIAKCAVKSPVDRG